MDPLAQLVQEFQAFSRRLDALERSVNSLKRIFFWILVVSVLGFVLPLIGLIFVIPQFLENYTSALNF